MNLSFVHTTGSALLIAQITYAVYHMELNNFYGRHYHTIVIQLLPAVSFAIIVLLAQISKDQSLRIHSRYAFLYFVILAD